MTVHKANPAHVGEAALMNAKPGDWLVDTWGYAYEFQKLTSARIYYKNTRGGWGRQTEFRSRNSAQIAFIGTEVAAKAIADEIAATRDRYKAKIATLENDRESAIAAIWREAGVNLLGHHGGRQEPGQ